MSSPFQKAFSSKSPLNKHKEVKKLLRQAKGENKQDRDHERIADLEAELVEARKAHPKDKKQVNLPSTGEEQQSVVNMNYESKKKTESVVQMRSPLNSYADGGRGEVYLSDVDLIQNAANAVSTAAMDIENESARSKANRQSKRVDRREKRGVKKGEGTIDKATGEYKATNATSKFNEKTGKIRKKAAGNILEADVKLKDQMDYDKKALTDTEYFKEYGRTKQE